MKRKELIVDPILRTIAKGIRYIVIILFDVDLEEEARKEEMNEFADRLNTRLKSRTSPEEMKKLTEEIKKTIPTKAEIYTGNDGTLYGIIQNPQKTDTNETEDNTK